MTWEEVAALALMAQLVILAAGALFAYLQLGSLRRQQEAELVQRIFDELNAEQFAAALDFVYNDLPRRLTEPNYVREIAEGRATSTSHRELIVMHFFNSLGILVHARMVREYPIVPFVASPCIRSWQRVIPVIELMRRSFPHAYTPFESLVVRSRAVDLSAINARFQRETPHLRQQWERTARELVDQRIELGNHGRHDSGSQ